MLLKQIVDLLLDKKDFQGNQTKQNVGNEERLFSSLIGTGLALWGMKQRGPLRYAIAFGGLGLIRRGLSGHCALYQKTGISTARMPKRSVAGLSQDEVKQEASDFTKAVTVRATAQIAYDFWRDEENFAKIFDFVDRVEPQGESRQLWHLKALGTGEKARSIEVEIHDFSPTSHIAWHTLNLDLNFEGRILFEERENSAETRINLYLAPVGATGAARGIAKLFTKLIAENAVEKRLAEALRRFKQLLETGEIATTDGQSHGKRNALISALHKTKAARDQSEAVTGRSSRREEAKNLKSQKRSLAL